MIVVDTNIITYFHLPTEFTTLAGKLYLQDPNWTAPFLWQSEFRNVLSLYVKKEIITHSDSLDYFEMAYTLLRGNEFSINAEKVLYLAKESGCSAYDCEFVSLAQELKVPLITADRKVLKAFPNTAVSLKKFVK